MDTQKVKKIVANLQLTGCKGCNVAVVAADSDFNIVLITSRIEMPSFDDQGVAFVDFQKICEIVVGRIVDISQTDAMHKQIGRHIVQPQSNWKTDAQLRHLYLF